MSWLACFNLKAIKQKSSKTTISAMRKRESIVKNALNAGIESAHVVGIFCTDLMGDDAVSIVS